MAKGRLFVAKTMRPDITKFISDRIYHGENYAASDLDEEQLSPYPGSSLKGCSKDGKDGKEGSDGKEGASDGKETCDGPDDLMSIDEFDRLSVIDLSALFKPQKLDGSPGPVVRISGGTK